MKNLFLPTGLVFSLFIFAACEGAKTNAAATVTTETAVTAASLDGRWVSTTDPKSEVDINGSAYLSIYDGKEMAKDSCIFGACDNNACTINGENPGKQCLTVLGKFDASCYVVMNCTKTDLEMAFIGGASGQTLKYKRK